MDEAAGTPLVDILTLSLQASKSDYKQLYSMLRLVCDNEPDMIWQKDVEGRYIFCPNHVRLVVAN